MAGTSIKGITIELNGDTTGLTSAIKKVNDPLKTTQADLKKVERLLKLDPTNTQLLAQKQKLLGQTVNETKEKLSLLKEAAKQANEQLQKGEISQEQYDALQREIVATEQSLKSLESAAAKSNVALEAVGAVADKVAAGANKVADATRGISAAAGGVLAALGGMAYSAMTSADDLNTLAKQTGFTTAELQKMQYAADLVDVSVDAITSSAQKLKKNMGSGSESVSSAFETLKVSVIDSNGAMRDSTTVYWEVIDALSRVSNETERDQLAMTLLGKGADELAGIIDDGGRALHELGDEAERAGLIMSQETLDSLNKTNDAVDKLKATANATLAETGAKALEAFLPVLEKILYYINAILNWIGGLNSEQISMLATILLIVAAISPVASIIGSIASAVSSLIPLLAMASAALGGGIWVAAVVAIAAIIGWLVYQVANYWDEIKLGAQIVCENIKNFFSNAANDIKQTFGYVGEAFRMFGDTWKGLFEAIANGISNVITSAVNFVINGVNAIINAVRSAAAAIASIFSFGGGGGRSGGGSIPMFANGGSLTRGSAIVGEAGPELLTVAGGRATVTPLTATLDSKSMAALSNAGSGAQKVSVNVNFTGSLAQLAAVLQPAITAETSRQGVSLAR